MIKKLFLLVKTHNVHTTASKVNGFQFFNLKYYDNTHTSCSKDKACSSQTLLIPNKKCYLYLCSEYILSH